MLTFRSLLFCGLLILFAPGASGQPQLEAGTPSVNFANPYLGNSYASQLITWRAGQVAIPEFAFQVYGTSAIGGANNTTAFKGSIGGFMTCNSDSADCYSGNFVANLSSGLSTRVTGISLEADLNVANGDYGNLAGAPSTPYAAALYISGTGPGNATCAICVNYAAGGIAFNRGLVFWNGTTNLNTIEDYTSSPNGAVLYASGSKLNGIDFSASSMAGSGILMPNNIPALVQADTGGKQRLLVMLNDSNRIVLGDGLRPVVVPGTINAGSAGVPGGVLSLENSAASCLLRPEASTLIWSCSSDARLKTNIHSRGTALPYLNSFNVRDYTVTADHSQQTGVVAQEVALQHPDMVHEAPDGYLRVDGINPWVLVKAIQELEARVKSLEEAKR